jgi:hypothetical protein
MGIKLTSDKESIFPTTIAAAAAATTNNLVSFS